MGCGLVAWAFYGAGWKQVEADLGYSGRIIVTGAIAPGPIVLSIEGQFGQQVYHESGAKLGCIQADKRSVGPCPQEKPKDQPVKAQEI
jgi:hypothetical protein